MKANMYDNIRLLEDRVLDTLEKSDLESIREQLSKIKGPVICTGVGGSSVVSEFASKVLNKKNGVVSENVEMRDFNYKNLDGYNSVVACSYSGKNYGVETVFRNDLEKYLLSTGVVDGVNNLKYISSYPKEDSFISLGATLMPMSILLSYYLDGDKKVIEKMFEEKFLFDIEDGDVYEIMSGYDSSSAAKYLESTMVEAGIGGPIVHDKYSYCHGRSTLVHHNDHLLIMFNRGSELDKLLRNLLDSEYRQVIDVDGKFDDMVVDDFYFTYQMMLFTMAVAASQNKDLSRVQYSPVVKQLYRYRGGM